MKKIVTLNRLNGLLISLLLLVAIWGCRKETLVTQTTTDVNITGYLDKFPAQFSEFRKILEITGNASYLNAYGAYTLFAPTNDAVKAYLTKLNKTSVDQVDINVLKDMVRFHLLSDTIRSDEFTDGKLPSLTMYGQYLITGAQNVGGITHVVINRQANVVQADIKVGNGYIHSIDQVLVPAKYSVAQLIENNPKFSIFSQALKATGLYDTLNILPANNPNASRKFLTILAESDSVLKVAGINDYASLKAKLCTTGDPKNITDSLFLFMAYHIIFDAKYLADIASANSQLTMAPLSVLSTSLNGTTILLNDLVYMNIHEQGATIDRSSLSDNSATNGVQQNVLQHFTLKIRKPVRVDWDVCDQPELRKMTSVFRKTNSPYYTLRPGGIFPFADITWALSSAGAFGFTYTVNSPSGDLFVNHDFLKLDMGGPSRPMWWEFRTPLIPKGKYKVWVCYKRDIKSSGWNPTCQILVDGVPLPRLVEFYTKRPNTGTEGELEAQGWKQYTATAETGTTASWGGRLAGIIDIQSTDRHILRIQSVLGTNDRSSLDLIQFIPINDDQIFPRFNTDGSLLNR